MFLTLIWNLPVKSKNFFHVRFSNYNFNYSNYIKNVILHGLGNTALKYVCFMSTKFQHTTFPFRRLAYKLYIAYIAILVPYFSMAIFHVKAWIFFQRYQLVIQWPTAQSIIINSLIAKCCLVSGNWAVIFTFSIFYNTKIFLYGNFNHFIGSTQFYIAK